jgi:hypothetical protein
MKIKITITLEPEQLAKIDEGRGYENRSHYMARVAVEEAERVAAKTKK